MANPWEKYAAQQQAEPEAAAPWAKYGGGVAPTVPGMEKLGGVAPGPAKPPLPGLKDDLKSEGFLESAWKATKGMASGVADGFNTMRSPSFGPGGFDPGGLRAGQQVSQQIDDGVENYKRSRDTSVRPQERDEARDAAIAAVPFGSTYIKAREGNIGGAVGDIAPIVATAAAPKAMPAIRGAAQRIGIPNALERSAGVSYRKMLTPTAKDVVPQAESIAGGPSPSGPTGLVGDRPVALTRRGMMGKMQDKMQQVGPQTQTAYDGKPPLDPQPILDHLEALRQQKAIVKGTSVVSDPGLDAAISELKENIEAMRDQNGKVEARSLDDYKDKLNRGNVSPKGHMRALAPQTAAAIEKSLAGNIGGYLDTAYPDAAKINAAYRTAKQTNTFLEEQRRAEIAAESGVRTGTSSGFGAALKKAVPAPLRGIPNALSAATDSVGWDSASGAAKAKLAESLRPNPIQLPSNYRIGNGLLLGTALSQRLLYQPEKPLPHYADGGVISRPTLLVDAQTKRPTGLMAEAGPEAIVPMRDRKDGPFQPKAGSPQDPYDMGAMEIRDPVQAQSRFTRTPIEISNRDASGSGNQADGMYDRAANRIQINLHGKPSAKEMNSAILHEDVHSLLHKKGVPIHDPQVSGFQSVINTVLGRATDPTISGAQQGFLNSKRGGGMRNELPAYMSAYQEGELPGVTPELRQKWLDAYIPTLPPEVQATLRRIIGSNDASQLSGTALSQRLLYQPEKK